MAKFSVGTVKSNVQYAAAYAVYEAAGRCFEKAYMANPVIESRLRMEFRLLADGRREKLEDKLEEELLRLKLAGSRKLASLGTCVHFKEAFDREGKKVLLLWFETGFEELLAIVNERGQVQLKRLTCLDEGRWYQAA